MAIFISEKICHNLDILFDAIRAAESLGLRWKAEPEPKSDTSYNDFILRIWKDD